MSDHNQQQDKQNALIISHLKPPNLKQNISNHCLVLLFIQLHITLKKIYFLLLDYKKEKVNDEKL